MRLSKNDRPIAPVAIYAFNRPRNRMKISSTANAASGIKTAAV